MRRSFLLPIVLAACFCACKQAEPPTPAPTPSTSTPSTSVASIATLAPTPSETDAGADATMVAEDAGQTAVDAAADGAVSLYESDGAPLGQTDAFPSLASAGYDRRIKLLWNAILNDDPELAKPTFFPLVAYAQVKAIPKPAIDYEKRLLAAFARDIHAYHQKLGKNPGAAVFVRLDVPEAKAKWMEPGSEGNKLGYDRVLDSKLVLKRDDGKEIKLDVKSMISWRGEWYVVHLAGFK